VILVDETSVSQAEYTAMAFRSARRATVIGSTTGGADGNASPIPLPGGFAHLHGSRLLPIGLELAVPIHQYLAVTAARARPFGKHRSLWHGEEPHCGPPTSHDARFLRNPSVAPQATLIVFFDR
jgi:hypothetical protein